MYLNTPPRFSPCEIYSPSLKRNKSSNSKTHRRAISHDISKANLSFMSARKKTTFIKKNEIDYDFVFFFKFITE